MEKNPSLHNRIRAGALLFAIIILVLERPQTFGAFAADLLWALFVYFLAILAMYVIFGIYQDMRNHDDDDK